MVYLSLIAISLQRFETECVWVDDQVKHEKYPKFKPRRSFFDCFSSTDNQKRLDFDLSFLSFCAYTLLVKVVLSGKSKGIRIPEVIVNLLLSGSNSPTLFCS
jgi:hypothetical protein